MTKKLFFIIILFWSSFSFAKTICEVKNFKECLITNNNDLICEDDLYLKKTNGNLQFDYPPIKNFNIYFKNLGYQRNEIVFQSSVKYNDKFYDNKKRFSYNNHNQIFIYDEFDRSEKFLIFNKKNKNNFVMTENFEIAGSGSGEKFIRISNGTCYG